MPGGGEIGMDLSARVLGKNIAHALEERAHAAVLTIGRDTFGRGDLAAVECFNYIAAANLSRALAEFTVTSTKDVFDRIPPTALALPHVGAVALAVLGAAFEKKGLGGSTPLETWMVKHQRTNGMTPEQAIATFHTVKVRALAETKRERLAHR